MILALDTSSALTSVAAVAAGVVVERAHEDARRHAEVIAPLLAEVVFEIDVTEVQLVACGVGPGPYTGLRVGIASAIALGIAWDVPVVGICSLDALAAEAQASVPGHAVTVASDARRSEAYWARYSDSGARIEGPRVSPRAEVAVELGQPRAVWVARVAERHRGASITGEMGDLPLDVHGQDSGATAATLAGAVLLPPRPIYLRRPDAVGA